MKIATVIGTLNPQCSARGFEELRWVQTKTEEGILVAADPVGAQPGQMVLLAVGDAAGHYRMDYCTDALVVAVLENQGNNG